jgi:hypothetical protein
VSRKKNSAATAAPEPTSIDHAKAEIMALHDVLALRGLALQWAQNGLDLEQTTPHGDGLVYSCPQAAREATLRLHDAGELDASAADIAKLKTMRLQ